MIWAEGCYVNFKSNSMTSVVKAWGRDCRVSHLSTFPQRMVLDKGQILNLSPLPLNHSYQRRIWLSAYHYNFQLVKSRCEVAGEGRPETGTSRCHLQRRTNEEKTTKGWKRHQLPLWETASIPPGSGGLQTPGPFPDISSQKLKATW